MITCVNRESYLSYLKGPSSVPQCSENFTLRLVVTGGAGRGPLITWLNSGYQTASQSEPTNIFHLSKPRVTFDVADKTAEFICA